MSRDNGGTHGETRSSALWGTGNRGGDSRGNALWGKGGRGFAAILTVLFVTAIPLAGASKNERNNQQSNQQNKQSNLAPTYIDPVLEARAHETPHLVVHAIIQSENGFPKALKAFNYARDEGNDDSSRVKNKFKFVNSIAVSMEAKDVLLLNRFRGLTVTADSKIKLAGTVPTSNFVWPTAEGVRPLWPDTER